jgi:hypothetical protein
VDITRREYSIKEQYTEEDDILYIHSGDNTSLFELLHHLLYYNSIAFTQGELYSIVILSESSSLPLPRTTKAAKATAKFSSSILLGTSSSQRYP